MSQHMYLAPDVGIVLLMMILAVFMYAIGVMTSP